MVWVLSIILCYPNNLVPLKSQRCSDNEVYSLMYRIVVINYSNRKYNWSQNTLIEQSVVLLRFSDCQGSVNIRLLHDYLHTACTQYTLHSIWIKLYLLPSPCLYCRETVPSLATLKLAVVNKPIDHSWLSVLRNWQPCRMQNGHEIKTTLCTT